MAELDEKSVRESVRRALRQHLSLPNATSQPSAPSPAPASRPIIDETTISAQAEGSTFQVPAGAIVTPSARDTAMSRRVRLDEGPRRTQAAAPTQGRSQGKRRVAMGADHGGVDLKKTLAKQLQEEGYEVVDVGPFDNSSVDYPDYAYAVARLVSDGGVEVGIMIDGVGIGSCMAANKVPGVRASMCYDVSTAQNAREHNHANYLTLGGQLIGPLLAKQIVTAWLSTPFGPGRHANRVAKIMEIEGRYARKEKG